MATSKSKANEPVSKDNPRLLQRVSDGAYARATDQTEYVSMTSAMGYRDVTDEGTKSTTKSGSSNTGTGSGGTPTTDNTTSTSTK